MAVAEICRNSLHQYQGIWALGWRILSSVGAVVVLYAALAPLTASRGASWATAMALAANRGLELALVAVLLSLLLFARSYGVPLNLPPHALAAAFSPFST